MQCRSSTRKEQGRAQSQHSGSPLHLSAVFQQCSLSVCQVMELEKELQSPVPPSRQLSGRLRSPLGQQDGGSPGPQVNKASCPPHMTQLAGYDSYLAGRIPQGLEVLPQESFPYSILVTTLTPWSSLQCLVSV